VSEGGRRENVTEEPPDYDPRLELIRLEQEVQSLRFRLQVKDDALRVLNARLMTWEVELARGVEDATKDMVLALGPVWWLVKAAARVKRVLLPAGTRRGRVWRSISIRLLRPRP
jgi:hypothetical protein